MLRDGALCGLRWKRDERAAIGYASGETQMPTFKGLKSSYSSRLCHLEKDNWSTCGRDEAARSAFMGAPKGPMRPDALHAHGREALRRRPVFNGPYVD